MKLKIFLVFLVFTVLFFSCKKENINNEVKIAVPDSISSIPLFELNGKVINNKRLKVEVYKENSIAMSEFVSGKSDLIMTGLTQGLAGYNGNKNILHFTTLIWGVSSLLTNDPALKELKDFAGKIILVPFAKSPLDLQLRTILKKENLFDKIKIEYAPAAQAIPMLSAKKVSGICIHEPLASKLISEKKVFKVFLFSDKWAEVSGGERKSPQVSLFVKKDFNAKNKNLLKNIYIAVNASVFEIKDKPEVFADKYKDYFKTNALILTSAVSNTLYDAPGFEKSKELIIKYLKETGDNGAVDDNFFIKL